MSRALQALRREFAGLSRLPVPELVEANEREFDEEGYLEANQDVAEAVRTGTMASGWHHFSVFGRHEHRPMLRYPAASRLERLPVMRRWTAARRRLGALSRRQTELQTRVYDLEVASAQLRDMLQLVHGVAPPPPKHLQLRVVGNYGDGFIRSGFESVVPMLQRPLERAGTSLADFTSILDFGCGCGRALFALHRLFPAAALHGADIDPEAIGWLRENLPDLARFEVCPTEPPTPFADDSFDFVYGISVLTHLPEEMQFSWLAELRRVSRPGGYVLLTTHGATHVRNLNEAERVAFERTGFLWVPSGYGESISLPDFYQNSFHSHEYIRREWSRYFEVVDILEPSAAGEHQDVVLLRVPA